MMGGIGSGRPCTGRGKVEACRSLDVNRLNREGCLTPGRTASLKWKQDGEPIASIDLRAEADQIILSYRVRIAGGEWQDVEEPVSIVRVPCRLGGSRPYFVCPGVVDGRVCGRRVIKLYGAGRYFLCRHCYRLTYTSQSEGARDRTLRRANKIRMCLGGEPGMLSPFPERPRGMWHTTYERLRETTFAAERQAAGALAISAERLLARIERPKSRKKGFWA
jgi:hypothetical protein